MIFAVSFKFSRNKSNYPLLNDRLLKKITECQGTSLSMCYLSLYQKHSLLRIKKKKEVEILIKTEVTLTKIMRTFLIVIIKNKRIKHISLNLMKFYFN